MPLWDKVKQELDRAGQVAQDALDVATKYAQEREAFGKKLADQQAVQFKLANMSLDVEAARYIIQFVSHAIN